MLLRANSIFCCGPRHRAGLARRGLTLIELMLAVAVMGIMAVVLGSLAATVQTSNQYVAQRGEVSQHARVVLSRLERTVRDAHASEEFPGFLVLSETVGSWEFPDTLVVWHPVGPAIHPDGRPLIGELAIFCPDPNRPWCLMEIRKQADARTAPGVTDTTAWRAEINALKQDSATERVQLTHLLRVSSVASGGGSDAVRGAVFFHTEHLPSLAEWEDFEAGNVAWDNLHWAQSVYGSRTGLRQSRCTIELQFLPGEETQRLDLTGENVVPFFGSAAIYHSLDR